MTTFRGAMRSYTAAVNRAHRVQQQHNREAARRYKLQQKMEQAQNAIQAEADWRSYVNVLKSIHKDHSEQMDWNEIANEPKPIEPNKKHKSEEIIQIQIDTFKPSFIDKLFGLTEKRLNALNAKLEKGKIEDTFNHKLKLNAYAKEVEEWTKLQSMSKAILKKEEQGYKEALEYFKPFDDITNLGKQLQFRLSADHIDVELNTQSEGVIPDFELSLTSTGKLSRKDMSASKFNELYLEHICSCAIRIAKEITLYFPVSYITITVVSHDLNRATGHHQNNIILSVLINPKQINQLNLASVSVIETIKSFKNNLKFTKSNGFASVPKIDLENTFLSI